MRHFLLYAVIRLGLWAVIWWVLTLLDIGVMLAGVLAALIAMLLSILLLDRLRDAAAMRWKAADERRAERRSGEVDEDAEYEDAMLDAVSEADSAGADAADDVEASTAGPATLPDLEEPGPDTHGTEASDPEEPRAVRGSDQ